MKAYYVGVGGDGHLGRLNITHQFYQAFGEDEFNGIAGQKVDINAQFAAVEASIDKDWWRAAGSASSGRPATAIPTTTRRKGFDAILDNPNIAGGPFSFWNRAGHPARRRRASGSSAATACCRRCAAARRKGRRTS